MVGRFVRPSHPDPHSASSPIVSLIAGEREQNSGASPRGECTTGSSCRRGQFVIGSIRGALGGRCCSLTENPLASSALDIETRKHGQPLMAPRVTDSPGEGDGFSTTRGRARGTGPASGKLHGQAVSLTIYEDPTVQPHQFHKFRLGKEFMDRKGASCPLSTRTDHNIVESTD